MLSLVIDPLEGPATITIMQFSAVALQPEGMGPCLSTGAAPPIMPACQCLLLVVIVSAGPPDVVGIRKVCHEGKQTSPALLAA